MSIGGFCYFLARKNSSYGMPCSVIISVSSGALAVLLLEIAYKVARIVEARICHDLLNGEISCLQEMLCVLQPYDLDVNLGWYLDLFFEKVGETRRGEIYDPGDCVSREASAHIASEMFHQEIHSMIQSPSSPLGH